MALGLALVAAIAWAESYFSDAAATWAYQETDGEAAVTYVWPNSVNLTVPSEMNGLPVTHIEPRAFRGCACLESVCLPAEVVSLGENRGLLFYGCSSLKSIAVDEANAVYSSEDGILYAKGKRKLLKCPQDRESVTLSSNVTEIAIWSFLNCTNLLSVTLPDAVTSIGQEAFRDCKNLAIVDMPSSVTNIENMAFCGCDSLTTMVIPSAMHVIGFGAFQGCSGLVSMTIPETVTTIETAAFNLCSNLQSVILSEGLKRIKAIAFSYCISLESIQLPSTVVEITGGAFAGCCQLTDIQIGRASCREKCRSRWSPYH